MNPSPWQLVTGICLLSPILARGDDLAHPTPVISFAMPDEVDAPVDPDENAIAVFDDHSWREFIAINWPAKPGLRGVPDDTRRIGDFSDPATKVVWATWKADYELFQNKEQSLRNGLRSMGSPLVMICHSKVQATRKSWAPFRSSGISIRLAMAIPEDR